MIKIFYIKNVDRNNEKQFERYWNLTSYREESEIKPRKSEYKLMKELKDDLELEDIYCKCQNAFKLNHFFKGRSMMVGDLIEKNNELFICSQIGFKKINWSEKSQP